MSRQLRSGRRRGLSAQRAFLAKAMALALASTAFLSHTANAESGTLPPVVVDQQQQKPQSAPRDKNKAVKKNQQRETPHQAAGT